MKDILESLNKSRIKSGWLYGEKMNRIGDPFQWVDGEQLNKFDNLSRAQKFLQFLSMSGEIYKNPKQIRIPNYKKIENKIKVKLTEIFQKFIPFTSVNKLKFNKYLVSTASVKQQDYSFLKKFCKKLAKRINHLDIGPGLGANAIYSHIGFDSCYYALEAFPQSYKVQREFYANAISNNQLYLDVIECENLNLKPKEISKEINIKNKYKIKHIPSWLFDSIKDHSIDLVTATWVLNEVNPAGICWLLSNISRKLKPGGYFYIRDSKKTKPLRHNLNYDKFIVEKLKFKKIHELKIRNRIDMHGIPRLYQKTKKTKNMKFIKLYNLAYSFFSVTSHGGNYNRTNISSKNK